MGRRKKSGYFNARARQVVDDSEVRKSHQTPCVPVKFEEPSGTRSLSSPEPPGTSYGTDMDSNALVLPSKKADQKSMRQTTEKNPPKQLSKKQRKKLQKILEQKGKKEKVTKN